VNNADYNTDNTEACLHAYARLRCSAPTLVKEQWLQRYL